MTSDAEHLTLDQYKEKFAANVYHMSVTVRNLAVHMKQLTGWHENQTMAYEALAANILKQYIIKSGTSTQVTEDHITEMPRNYTKIDHKKYATVFKDKFPRGVEWDGALFVDYPTTQSLALYLIEAKTTIATSDIRDMTERIRRTKTFIELCHNKELPGSNAPRPLKALCDAWSEWGVPSSFCGVVLAHNFTDAMLQAAEEEKITCICLDGSAYVIHRPWLKTDKILRFEQIDSATFFGSDDF